MMNVSLTHYVEMQVAAVMSYVLSDPDFNRELT